MPLIIQYDLVFYMYHKYHVDYIGQTLVISKM